MNFNRCSHGDVGTTLKHIFVDCCSSLALFRLGAIHFVCYLFHLVGSTLLLFMFLFILPFILHPMAMVQASFTSPLHFACFIHLPLQPR